MTRFLGCHRLILQDSYQVLVCDKVVKIRHLQVPALDNLLLLPAEEAVSAACSELLGEELDRVAVIKELLLDGWLYQYYTR